MMLLNYIYYRIYKFAGAIAMGLSNVAPRAAAVLSFIVVLNTATLLGQVGLGLNKNSLAFYMVYFVIFFYFSFRWFSDIERKERVNNLFGSEPWWQSLIGNVSVATVCIATVVFMVSEAS